MSGGVERRLAAILAVDVVGYSGLMEVDEAGTIRRLKAIRRDIVDPAIHAHGGRIVKTTGDGMLVEFASAVAAVDCALWIQRAMADRAGDMRFRIGVNLGDIVIDGEDILGEGVNVAARLEALADPGGIAVSGTVHDQVQGKLDAVFTDDGAQQVKNIQRPVQVWRWSAEAPTAPGAEPSARATGDDPSIAVLPFANMSADPEQEFFCDGIAEDVITALSKIARLKVIARNSSFAYKGTSPDIRRVAEELGVRYVLEGSVRTGGSRIRVTAQLIDATDGGHLWAEHYDRRLDDVFEIQDEIVKEIVTNLRLRLTDGEQALMLSRGTDNIEAWQHCQRAMDEYIKHNASGHLRAREHAERAIALDPDYAAAWGTLAFAHWFEGRMTVAETSRESFATARDCAERAIALDARNSVTAGIATMVALSDGNFVEAVAIAEEALSHLPSNADARGFLAFALLHGGRYEAALVHFASAFALNPLPPVWYRNGHARALLCLGRLDESLQAIDGLLEAQPDHHQAWLYRAYIYQCQGRDAEAREAMTRASQLAPMLRVGHLPQFFLLNDPEMLERLAGVLTDAGMAV